jgi:hypothetical protein
MRTHLPRVGHAAYPSPTGNTRQSFAASNGRGARNNKKIEHLDQTKDLARKVSTFVKTKDLTMRPLKTKHLSRKASQVFEVTQAGAPRRALDTHL